MRGEAMGGETPFRIVITGGPCAGKTEVWRFLGNAVPGGVPVPEAATQLILDGKSEDSLGLEGFQRAVYERQLALEEGGREKGLLLLCDRGLLDGLAYFPSLFDCLEVSREKVLNRYAMVIQLEVIRDSHAYDMHFGNNPARHEDHERALALEKDLERVYEGHSTYFLLAGSLEEKKREALRLVRERLAVLRPDLAAKAADQA
jgi:predicted ATPase